MNTIYIDILITVNVFIDFMLIVCVKSFLNISVSLKRMILGSVAGGILSVSALLPRLPFLLNIFMDLFCAIIIVLICFGYDSIKALIKRTAVYFLVSFIFCGIMIFIYTAFKPSGMQIYNDKVYFNISPLVLIILTVVCYYIIMLIKRLTKGETGGGVYNVEVKIKSKSITFCAKVDTGCNLKEPFSGEYVIVAEKTLLESFEPDKNTLRAIPFNSLGGDGIIYGFKPDKVIVGSRDIGKSVYIGICNNVLKGDVKALIPFEIIRQ